MTGGALAFGSRLTGVDGMSRVAKLELREQCVPKLELGNE